MAFPEFWLYFLGALFIAVTLFLPQGVVGLVQAAARARPRTARHDARPDGSGRARASRRTSERDARSTTGSSGGRAAELRPRIVHAGRARRHPRRASSTSTTSRVSFDGFKALNELSLEHQRRRAALHHRPERRRQDDDDGRHHRQDAARRGHGLLRLDHRPAAPARERDRADRHRPQVPEADGVRAPHGVREPRAGAQGRPRRARRRCSSGSIGAAARPHRRGAAR